MLLWNVNCLVGIGAGMYRCFVVIHGAIVWEMCVVGVFVVVLEWPTINGRYKVASNFVYMY